MESFTNKSVKRDFECLLKLLTVQTNQIELMMHLRVWALTAQSQTSSADLEAEKCTALAKCRRRIEAARHLYEDGELSRKEYLKRKEANERENVYWEAHTSETEKIALELTLCLQAIDRITQLWNISDAKINRGWRVTFSITPPTTGYAADCGLKPWADTFITLRTSFYEIADDTENKNPSNDVQGVGKRMTLETNP